MLSSEQERRLKSAQTLDETKAFLKDEPRLDPEKVYGELLSRRDKETKKPDLDELEAHSGGRDRDWTKDGCAATCEWDS